MPRFHPTNDCDFYTERVIGKHHRESPENHILREIPFENSCKIFRVQDHSDPHRSVICSWGIGENFKKNTGLKCEKFIKSRIRKNASLPIAGRRGLWKITRIGPCGFAKLPLHTWRLEGCLCPESKTPVENSKSSSRTVIAHDCFHNKKQVSSADKNDDEEYTKCF